MPHTIDFLVSFVSFSCNEDDVFWLSKFYRHFYCLFSVWNRSIFAEILRFYACFYFFNYLQRLLCSRIIRSDNRQSGFRGSYIAHFRAFFLISISSTAENGNQPFVLCPNFIDTVQDIFQSIWRVGIIHNEENTTVRLHRFKSSVHSSQLRNRL